MVEFPQFGEPFWRRFFGYHPDASPHRTMIAYHCNEGMWEIADVATFLQFATQSLQKLPF